MCTIFWYASAICFVWRRRCKGRSCSASVARASRSVSFTSSSSRIASPCLVSGGLQSSGELSQLAVVVFDLACQPVRGVERILDQLRRQRLTPAFDRGDWLGVEFVASGVCGAVDPVLGERRFEDVACGAVLVDDDVHVVGVAAAGHGYVDAALIGGPVDQHERVVDGAALRGVAGLRVAEFDVRGDVGGG